MGFQENAEALGGADIKILENPDSAYFDKIDHFLRSVFHSRNHLKHFSKIAGPPLETPSLSARDRSSAVWYANHRPIIRARNQK